MVPLRRAPTARRQRPHQTRTVDFELDSVASMPAEIFSQFFFVFAPMFVQTAHYCFRIALCVFVLAIISGAQKKF